MEQQLVVAPLFNRIAVDAKTFRVPVADEDTDGDVAQFASGTFATGIADATRVPTSNQNTISSVDFTPHKFMATTHLAKDEEEDTVLPLLDFLRAAATRRLARAIDKSILTWYWCSDRLYSITNQCNYCWYWLCFCYRRYY